MFSCARRSFSEAISLKRERILERERDLLGDLRDPAQLFARERRRRQAAEREDPEHTVGCRQRRVADPLHTRRHDVRVQRFPPGRVRVRDVHVHGAIEGSEPRLVWFPVEPDLRRQLVGPRRSGRIDHERSELALFVDEIQVRVIVRDDPPDVRHDGRTQRGDVTLR